ncbi:hypothetical protein AGMMS50212_05760 [Spirochaetia bacterium]|nr:hypothetical protein AGMMS50212_05760 [Spirochaetia bacterium]
MENQVYKDQGYEIHHVNYGGRYGGDDTVCQVQSYGQEIAHCTWHPGSNTPNPHGSCPYRGQYHCLDK